MSDLAGQTKSTVLVTTLPAGWAFPPMELDFSPAVVQRYVEAVGAGSDVQGPNGAALVPPGAFVALCQKACLEVIHLPPECLHISQEMELDTPIEVGERLSLSAVIQTRTERGEVTVIRVAMAAVDDVGRERARSVASMLVASGS